MISEVNHGQAQLVVQWGTTLEFLVLLFFVALNTTGQTSQEIPHDMEI